MADGLNLEAERAAFEAWFGKPLMNPEQPSHFNGSAARKAWEAWLESGNRRTPPAPSTAPSDGLPETTDDARAYLVRWHREAFTTAPFFSSYIENTLAGDFAYHLARWLARHANKKGT